MYLGVAMLSSGSGPYLLGTVRNFLERVHLETGEVRLLPGHMALS
jgi:hypothetical protein